MNQMTFRFFINEITKFLIFWRKFSVRLCANNPAHSDAESWRFSKIEVQQIFALFTTFVGAFGAGDRETLFSTFNFLSLPAKNS